MGKKRERESKKKLILHLVEFLFLVILLEFDVNRESNNFIFESGTKFIFSPNLGLYLVDP